MQIMWMVCKTKKNLLHNFQGEPPQCGPGMKIHTEQQHPQHFLECFVFMEAVAPLWEIIAWTILIHEDFLKEISKPTPIIRPDMPEQVPESFGFVTLKKILYVSFSHHLKFLLHWFKYCLPRKMDLKWIITFNDIFLSHKAPKSYYIQLVFTPKVCYALILV